MRDYFTFNRKQVATVVVVVVVVIIICHFFDRLGIGVPGAG